MITARWPTSVLCRWSITPWS